MVILLDVHPDTGRATKMDTNVDILYMHSDEHADY